MTLLCLRRFYNADIPYNISEFRKRSLISSAFASSDSLFQRVKLDQSHAFIYSGLIDLRRQAARENPAPPARTAGIAGWPYSANEASGGER